MTFVANGERFAVADVVAAAAASFAIAVVDGGLIGKMASKNIGGDAGGKWNDNALDTNGRMTKMKKELSMVCFHQMVNVFMWIFQRRSWWEQDFQK